MASVRRGPSWHAIGAAIGALLVGVVGAAIGAVVGLVVSVALVLVAVDSDGADEPPVAGAVVAAIYLVPLGAVVGVAIATVLRARRRRERAGVGPPPVGGPADPPWPS